MFRNPADRIPVLIALVATLVDFVLYFTVDNVWLLAAAWFVSMPLTGAIGAWSHHHQHCFTFKSVGLNRALELCHALQAGISTHLWVLHHVFGHHLNYLDQTKDQSGKQMGVVEYIFTVTFTSYFRAFQVGRSFPQYQRSFVTWSIITLGLVVTLAWYRPIPALFLFILPMVTGLMWVVWATYDHHAGLPTDDPWEASYNIENRLYNRISCNLGYHTAHHYKQGVHWSKLPELHEQIRDQIPEHLFVKSTFDKFFPD